MIVPGPLRDKRVKHGGVREIDKVFAAIRVIGKIDRPIRVLHFFPIFPAKNTLVVTIVQANPNNLVPVTLTGKNRRKMSRQPALLRRVIDRNQAGQGPIRGK